MVDPAPPTPIWITSVTPVPAASRVTPPVPACMVVVEVVFVEPTVKVLTAPPVPRLIVSAEASVPISICPVVPELMVRVSPAAEVRSTAPAPV